MVILLHGGLLVKLGIITCTAFIFCSFLFTLLKSHNYNNKQVKKNKDLVKNKEYGLLNEILKNSDHKKAVKQAEEQATTTTSKSERGLKLLQNTKNNILFLMAVNEGDIDLCGRLLANGVDCNFANNNDDTALAYAIDKHSDEKAALIVDFLLTHGANPNRLNKRKYGPLLIAT